MELSKQTTIKLTLIGFLLTFTLIFYFEENNIQSIKQISEISLKNLNQNVKIEGEIIKQTLSGDHLFLTIKDNSSSIKIVGFFAKNKLNPAYKYIIEGKVTLHKKELEIIANKIEIKP